MRLFPQALEPKLLTTLREGYTLRDLGRDALAGVVVGIVALPLAIAFGIASGVRPEQGIYTAIVAGFLISVFGGSRVQIGGPTGAFIVIVAGVVAEFGYEGLAVATVMAGAFLILFAVARLGDVMRYIPYPVTVGFTSGIAVIIAAGQLEDALGLPATSGNGKVWSLLAGLVEHLPSVRFESIALCLGTIVVIRVVVRLKSRVPGPLLALLLGTAIVRVFDLDVVTIGSRFGNIPSALPTPSVPAVDWSRVPDLVSPAISIALLAGIESLLSAMVADGMVRGRHRSNAELLAQGIANVASPFFGGIPATGAIARTATNVRSGGRTPVAGIVHSLTLLAIVLAFGTYAAWIPMASLAGILLVVAYNMSEWHAFVRNLRGPRSDALVLLTTFFLTVAVDLTVAIQAGVVLAALLFMRRMVQVTEVRPIRELGGYEEEGATTSPRSLPPSIEVFEIHGTFCFGAARKFSETLAASSARTRVLVLSMEHVLAIDATGLHALEEVAARLRSEGTALLLAAPHAQPLMAMQQSGCLAHIGVDNVFATCDAAIARALTLVKSEPGVAGTHELASGSS